MEVGLKIIWITYNAVCLPSSYHAMSLCVLYLIPCTLTGWTIKPGTVLSVTTLSFTEFQLGVGDSVKIYNNDMLIGVYVCQCCFIVVWNWIYINTCTIRIHQLFANMLHMLMNTTCTHAHITHHSFLSLSLSPLSSPSSLSPSLSHILW